MERWKAAWSNLDSTEQFMIVALGFVLVTVIAAVLLLEVIR